MALVGLDIIINLEQKLARKKNTRLNYSTILLQQKKLNVMFKDFRKENGAPQTDLIQIKKSFSGGKIEIRQSETAPWPQG